MSFKTWLISFLITLALARIAKAERQIIFLTEIINRGANTPYRLSYYNNVPEYAKRYGESELTSVGYRQHYLLGKQLKKDYAPFFDNIDVSKKEVAVRSMMRNKTFESAQAHLNGLFQRKMEIPTK